MGSRPLCAQRICVILKHRVVGAISIRRRRTGVSDTLTAPMSTPGPGTGPVNKLNRMNRPTVVPALQPQGQQGKLFAALGPQTRASPS